MKDREILDHIKNGIDEAPIDLLDAIKSQTVVKMISHDLITRQNKIQLKPLLSFASAVAVFLLVFFNYQQFKLPDSEIYLDINPGIHITTNKRDKVIELLPINEEAVNVLEGIEFKGKDLELVAEDILDSLVDKNYLEDGDEIMLLSIYNKDLEKSKRQVIELDKIINNKLDHTNPILLTQSLDKSNTVDEYAKTYGISVGKMTFITNMIILNPDLKTEELVNLTLTELIEISQITGLDIERIIDVPTRQLNFIDDNDDDDKDDDYEEDDDKDDDDNDEDEDDEDDDDDD